VTLAPRRAAFFILLAIFFLRASAQAPGPTTESSEDGLQLLRRMQSALGGADTIAAIHDYEETVRAEIWDNKGTPLGAVRKRTRWMQKPNLLRLDQRGPRDTYVLYFDGGSGSGWEMLPDMKNPDKFRTTGEAIDLIGDELKFAKGYLSGFEFNLWLADRNPGYIVTSLAPNVLRIEHDGSANDFTLDPASWLPIVTHSTSNETRYEGWTEVTGVRFPTHRTLYHGTVKVADLVAEESIHVNAGLKPQDLASKPTGLAPDIPGR
jgi:hypothetical protein